MKTTKLHALLVGAGLIASSAALHAAPSVTRLTPPSFLFSYGDSTPPYTARFITGQRFDLQATIKPDSGKTITKIEFKVDNVVVPGAVTLTAATATPASTFSSTIGTRRAYANEAAGAHTLAVTATQSDGLTTTAYGNFEIIPITGYGIKAKNIIFVIGDGMGIAHRTAARIMSKGVLQGKANEPLEMDKLPFTGIVSTSSLNSIVTDSAPGASCYSSGNKNNNNQEGVFPDDTTDKFDNPRTELLPEYLARSFHKSLGIITTADVFDATPAAWGVHTQDRGAGTGICDQYLDETSVKANLTVLLGGGRKWFLPSGTTGSARATGSDYVLPDDLATAWGVNKGVIDPARDLIADFKTAGFTYAADKTALVAAKGKPKMLGLFAYSNMNVAKDKIDGRRNASTIVNDYGFPDQPMLDEMVANALPTLAANPNGFVLMIEGASIDKQAHNMDTERWILDTIELDRAIGVCNKFIESNPSTLIAVTADHECAGINIIGASKVTNSDLTTRSTSGAGTASGGPRNGVVGTYDAAGFPQYSISADGYPATTDIDYKMLVGYAAGTDRYEDWLTNAKPLRDGQQPLNGSAPLNTYPNDALSRDVAGGFRITGYVEDTVAAHTASDVPISAGGSGKELFTGVMDNTDVFFKLALVALGNTPLPNADGSTGGSGSTGGGGSTTAIDTVAPTIRGLYPTVSSDNRSISVRVDATDNNGGFTSKIVYVGKLSGGAAGDTSYSGLNVTITSASKNVRVYEITVEVRDTAGNTSYSKVNVTVAGTSGIKK